MTTVVPRLPAVHPTAVTPRLSTSGSGVDALLAEATREVLVLSTSAVATTSPFRAVRRIDHWNLRRGVRQRVVAPDEARTAPVLGPQLAALAMAGADARTVAEVPADALIIDGTVVVVPAEGAAGVAVLRVPGVVAGLVALFDRVWADAVPLLGADLPGAADLAERERELLELLTAGCTDESAAVRLGVSVRTVRRMVSEMMRRLGARSRFQAGAKAAERGWLRTG